MEVRKCVGRRGIVKGAAAGVSAAGVLVAGGVGTKAQVPAAGFPLHVPFPLRAAGARAGDQ